MRQPEKQSDSRGAVGQNVKGSIDVRPLRLNDQNVKHANQPQNPEAKHPHQTTSGER